MTAVLDTPVVTERRVAAIQVRAAFADSVTFDMHTWRWKCTCGLRSICTFPTAEEADRYGALHTCRTA